MKERGMIFNAEMVRAILDGRKTQTRRIMAIQPEHSELGLRRVIDSKNGRDNGKYFWSQSDARGLKMRSKVFGCPYGEVGDRIWGRETYQGPLFDYEHMESYLEDSSKFYKPEFCVYRADGKPAPEFYDADDNLHCGWRPSIHMPRWASRLTLEANQSQTTPTGIQLITEAIGAHGYIVGCLLQGRPDLALEESRKWVSAFGQAAEIVSAQDTAGIKVKG